jgi:hypothetical protein
MYHVNAFELRRYLNKLRPLPTVNLSAAPAQDPILCSDTNDWSTSVQSSVA